MNPLSEREMQVAELVHQGKIEKEIADELCVSTQTVHTHTKNIRRKLNARNAADITRIYLLELKPYAVAIIIGLIMWIVIKIDPDLIEKLETAIVSLYNKLP